MFFSMSEPGARLIHPDLYLPRIGDLDFLAGLGDSPGFLSSANRGLDCESIYSLVDGFRGSTIFICIPFCLALHRHTVLPFPTLLQSICIANFRLWSKRGDLKIDGLNDADLVCSLPSTDLEHSHKYDFGPIRQRGCDLFEGSQSIIATGVFHNGDGFHL